MIESLAIEKRTGCGICDIVCPGHIVDVHPSVKNRPRPW
jgi:hypothetical protein